MILSISGVVNPEKQVCGRKIASWYEINSHSIHKNSHVHIISFHSKALFYGTSKRTFCFVWIRLDETHFLLLDNTSIANENTWVMKVEREKVFFQLPTTVWRHCSEQNEKIRVECLHYNPLRFERLHWSSVMFRIKWFPRSQFIPHFPSHSFDQGWLKFNFTWSSSGNLWHFRY